MKHEQIIAPTAGAVTTSANAGYTTDGALKPINGVSCDLNATEDDKVLVYTQPILAGVETVLIYVVSASGQLIPVYNAAGTAAQLSATVQSVMLEGGFYYRFVKAATVAPTSLEAYLKARTI